MESRSRLAPAKIGEASKTRSVNVTKPKICLTINAAERAPRRRRTWSTAESGFGSFRSDCVSSVQLTTAYITAPTADPVLDILNPVRAVAGER